MRQSPEKVSADAGAPAHMLSFWAPITRTLPVCHRYRSESRVLRFCVPGQKRNWARDSDSDRCLSRKKRYSESGSGRETWGYHSSRMLAMSIQLLDRHFCSACKTGVVLFVRSCFATCSPQLECFLVSLFPDFLDDCGTSIVTPFCDLSCAADFVKIAKCVLISLPIEDLRGHAES